MEQLIVGGSGFLGSHLTSFLNGQGHTVTICDTQAPPHHFDGNYCTPDNLQEYTGGFEIIYLIAAVIPYGAMETPSQIMTNTNALLVEHVRRLFPAARIILASSASVYGTPIALPLHEHSPFVTPNAYGLSKLAGETLLAAHPDYAILRFSSIYGPQMKARTFLPLVVESAVRTKRIKLFGDGSRLQNYLHVADAARMLYEASKIDNTITVNAVSPQSFSNKDVADFVAQFIEDVEISFEGEDNSASFRYDDSLWREHFSYSPQISLAQGIQEMLNDY